MRNFDSIIFDLDGTIWDSREACAIARNKLVEKLALPIPRFTAADTQKTMGMPMDKVYATAFPNLPKEKFEEVRRYLDAEILVAVKNDEASLFPEVETTLAFLAGHVPLFVVSNCSTPYLKAYLDWSNHGKFYKDFLCNGDNGLSKAENIKLIMRRNGLRKSVYVGDTAGDHTAATEAGTDYIHVDYGFGQPNGECRRISDFSQLKTLFV